MSAAYDSYDYPSYWIGREYEHQSEILAIRHLIHKIPKINTILEVGSGFGRLVSTYSFRAKKIILTDPSSKLLKLSRDLCKGKKNFKFIHASLSKLKTKVKPKSVDLVVMVRVIHHINDVSEAFGQVSRILKLNGYFLLEFANKVNLKASLKNFMHGNFTYPLDIFTMDLRSPKSVKKKTLPFLNYHPHLIQKLLKQNGLEVLEWVSVSNFRSSFLKRVFATSILLHLEKVFQKLFTYTYFGPSIFVLVKKIG